MQGRWTSTLLISVFFSWRQQDGTCLLSGRIHAVTWAEGACGDELCKTSVPTSFSLQRPGGDVFMGHGDGGRLTGLLTHLAMSASR